MLAALIESGDELKLTFILLFLILVLKKKHFQSNYKALVAVIVSCPFYAIIIITCLLKAVNTMTELRKCTWDDIINTESRKDKSSQTF